MTQFLLQKIRDEGSAEPYIARLWLGIFELSDTALSLASPDVEKSRRDFAEAYLPVLNDLDAARASQKDIEARISGHRDKLDRGEITQYQPRAVQIDESVDLEVRSAFSNLINASARAAKAMQSVTGQFAVSIGCLFTKDANFAVGLATLRTRSRPLVADYLSRVRSEWSETLMQRRTDLEHNRWHLPQCEYRLQNETPDFVEPEVDGCPVSHYAHRIASQVMAFVEDLTVYSLSTLLPSELCIAERPVEQRDPARPTRFVVAPAGAAAPPWALRYSEAGFQ